MTDDQNSNPQQEAEEHVADGLQPGAENASDPTPAEEAELAAIDHSAWMRPPVGETRRTAEVVDALAPEPPEPVDEEPVDEEQPEQQVEQPATTPTPAHLAESALAGHQMAAVIGARAARARDHVPGASLDHAPEIPDLGATAVRPSRSGLARLMPWLAAALAAALAVFGIVYATTRKDVVVVTETPTPTVSKPPVVQDTDLFSAADAARVQPVKGWAVASTADKLSPQLRITCQPNTQGQPNPNQSKQRTLTTPPKTGLAALHQVDNFSSVADASKAFGMRAANLASCSDAPSWIYGAVKATGLGDESASQTISYQDQVAQFHTIVLTRTGTTLHALDITSSNRATNGNNVAKALAGPVNRQCARSGGACARSVTTQPAIPAVSGTPGWLIPADLPRITPGAGLWTATDTTNVTAKGTTCENLTLSSVSGPTKREQRTYLMTQDNAAPQTYGVDEVLFTFAKPAGAQAFAKTLWDNLNGCPKRQATAKVSEPAAPKVAVQGKQVTANTLQIQQSMGGSQTARYRVAVVVEGNHVAYLVNNPSASYDLGNAKFQQVALRAGLRASQA
ncbi:hypothetical protein [Luteococcus peritonei]|uniref:PknH-like extracellular domain-containing protein n=1 Tax=Luteococcus peritonei TaxID=88874 RepID=A0ABW4RWF7_9ACTN